MDFKKLSIYNWKGSYGSTGSSGTAAKLFINSSMNQDDLDQLQFIDNNNDYYSLQITSNEIVPGTDRTANPTGYANIKITNDTTTNGSWSGGTTGPYVFNPTDDNAILNTNDITERLNGTNGYTPATVSITTVASSGTQIGSIYVDYSITAKNNKTAAQTLILDAHGGIIVNKTIYLGPYYYYNNYSGHSIELIALEDVQINGSIFTAYTSSSELYGGNLSDAGDITITAGGDLDINSYLRANAIDNTYNSSSAYAGDAGNVSLSARGISLATYIDLSAGDSTYGASRDGAAGNLSITTSSTSLTSGGTNDGQTAGYIYAKNISKYGSGVFKLYGDNNFTGTIHIDQGTLIKGSAGAINDKLVTIVDGTLDLYGSSHQVADFSGSGTLTSAAAGNITLTLYNSNGEFSGTIEDGSATINLVKNNASSGYSNSKITTLSGNNSYSGLTTIKSYAKLIITHNNALGTTNAGTVVESNGGLYLQNNISIGNEPLSLSGSGYSSYIQGALQNTSGNNSWNGPITLTGDTEIFTIGGSLELTNTNTIYGDNKQLKLYGDSGSLTISGTINLGVDHLYKYGDHSLYIKGANSSTGITYIYDGKLYAQHPEALGDPSANYTQVSSGSLIIDGGVNLNSRELRISGNGFNSEGVLQLSNGSNTLSNIILIANSKLQLSSDNYSHTITLLNLSSRTLTIGGWQGDYGNALGGTPSNGRLFIGHILTSEELALIQFYDGTNYYEAVQIIENELVPGSLKSP